MSITAADADRLKAERSAQRLSASECRSRGRRGTGPHGREVLNACFDANFDRDKSIVAFGEDVGAIGDVNQGFAGLQGKYGDLHITDTGIREATIIGQGMGLAMRGLRPIAEIQYLDYLLYAMTVISDDIASLSYRTAGGQKAPLIIRTRGHRLEGIWHSGSPMAGISNDPLGDLAPAATYAINHEASVRLATLAKEAGVTRYVFSSSCSNYGAAGDSFLDETANFNPVTPYAESKVWVERDVAKLIA